MMAKVAAKTEYYQYGNNLILPDQPYSDEFLVTMTTFFHRLRWVGIVGGERLIWKIWGSFILSLFIAIQIGAIWKVTKALAGWASDTIGDRSVTARLAGAMFYTGTLIGLILCWRLSCSWKGLSSYWTSLEVALSIKYANPNKNIKRQMYKVVIFVALCSILEHIMSIVISSDLDCELGECLQKYILKSHAFLLLNNDYNNWLGVPLFFMSNLATIIWNLQDLIIILISIGLTSRYQRLNQCVATISNMSIRNKFWCKNIETLKVYTWRRIREAYVKQSMLVRKVDLHLGELVLASCFFNFYFICLQLFLGITRGLSQAVVEQMYYMISLAWLCTRTIFTILAAADVNRSSRLALPYLYECRPQFYNIEIERLQKQLTQEYIALSGKGFFYLNRTIVLQMAAAVFTYALVLIQYDDSDHKSFKNVTNTKV